MPNQIPLKFFLFKFHNTFHGLLGLDNLKLLQAQLDFSNGFLITPYTKIKLKYYNTNNNLNLITIFPRSEQVIKVKTSIRNGEIILPHQKIHNCEIPECLTVAKNGEAITTILNNTTQKLTLDFSKPINVEKFNHKDMQQIILNNFDDSEKQNLDLSKLRVNHLNSEERHSILKICKEFSDIFYNEHQPLTFTSKIKHRIKTSDEVPVYTKSYRYPFIHRKEVTEQMKKMLEQNIIRPSNSPWSSPIWVVPKKLDASGKQKWRVVVDYRKLNEKTINDKYPLPNITDLLDKLGRCQYFTTLDLASGFHQIEMEDEDIQKTAFNTEHGHYEYLRMPFGLKNAPATFQRVMDNILRGIQNEKCLTYLDDIIVFSTSLQEHLDSLKCVFKRLRESNFKIQLDKSEFLKKEVAYLGHIVTPDGVKPNPDKIKAIKKFPIPRTTKEIKGFLGLLGYYRRFIKDFAKLSKPLTKCLKKGAKIVHNEEFLSCFEACKNVLINEPILQYPDFSRPFNLTTDASNVAIGAVLSQGTIGQDLPVAYASRTLNESEQNYSVIEKELLAIVWATKYFRPYLYGRQFNIITDHKPLQWLFSLKDPNSKLLRWRIKLEEYDYKIFYKKGKLNTNADALSRVEIHTKETEFWEQLDDIISEYDQTKRGLFDKPTTSQQIEPPIDLYTDTLPDVPVHEDIVDNTDNVSMLVQPDIENELANNQEQNDDVNTIHSNDEQDPIVGIPICESPVNFGANQIIISEVLHSPTKPKIKILFEKKRRFLVQLSKDNFENDILKFVKEFVLPEKMYYLYFENPNNFEPFCEVIRKNFKWPSIQFKRCTIKLIDVVTKNDIQDVIKNYHEGKSNHRGIDETEQKIKSKYYWPNLKSSIQSYINDCEICQLSKYERNPVKIPINITPTPTKPFQIVHLDTYTYEKTKFLTIIDSFSKYAQAYYLNSLTASDIVNNLLIYFSHHGIPSQIILDNGTEFKNSVVTELFELHKIKTHFCSPNHPQSNGMVERLHSTLSEHIRLLNNKGFQTTPVSQKITYAILAYNHTIHSVTNLKPIDIINGHVSSDDPFDIDINKILITDYIESHREKSKILYSKLNEKLINHKESVANKINKDRDDPELLFKEGQKAYPKKFVRQKNSDKFHKPVNLDSVDLPRKTATSKTRGKIHLSNLKRPLKHRYSFNN